MMQDLPGENNPKNLQIIIDEVNRLNVLVNDMLDLSKISSKTIELHPQLYSITDNLIEIVERYQNISRK
ncbi:MAG: histidine kinase dimerization/phospho-acceptor domain-containing protein [Christensenellales bacterium]